MTQHTVLCIITNKSRLVVEVVVIDDILGLLFLSNDS
jgi:hypothetical protein